MKLILFRLFARKLGGAGKSPGGRGGTKGKALGTRLGGTPDFKLQG